MRRRQFMTLAGGVILLRSLSARAQQPSLRVIGFLSSASNITPGLDLVPTAFRKGLNEGGYFENRNVAIEVYRANGRYDRLPDLAADMVRHQVSLIVAAGGLVSAQAAKAATATIPILIIAGFDPIKLGLVSSLNRPGGNITGLSVYTTELVEKRLELLRDLMPRTALVALLINPRSPVARIETEDMEGVARAASLQLLTLNASDEGEVETAFASAARNRVDALLISADPFFTTRRRQLVALAARHGLPAIYPWREYTEIGGLMSYGPNLMEAYHKVGLYAGRILNGASPGDLPLQLPKTFELMINQRTAAALGLKISRLLLLRADKVID